MGAKYANAQQALAEFQANGTPIPVDSQLSFLDAKLVMFIAMAIFALAFVVLSVMYIPRTQPKRVRLPAQLLPVSRKTSIALSLSAISS